MPAATTAAQYRLYSPITNEHLYTTDANEYAVLATTGLVGLGLPEVVLTVVLALLAVASLITVLQRMLLVRKQALETV